MKANSNRKIHIRHSIGEGGITTLVEALIDLNESSDVKHDILVWKELPVSFQKYTIIDMSKSVNRKKDFANLIQDYDTVFVHSLMPFMLLPLLKKKPNVYLFQHGITFGRGRKKIFKQLYYFLVINLFRFKIICSSNFAKKKLLAKVPVLDKELISIIGFGINMENQIKIAKDNSPVLRIGFAGRLVAQKRVSKIIKALDLIKHEVAVECHIAGNGPLQKDIEHSTVAFNDSKVSFEFYGFIEDMNNFYSQLDVFILPSKGESFGLVVLEAISRGIPTIVFSDTGACVEFIESNKNGYIVDSHVELAQRIKQLNDISVRNDLKHKMMTMDLSKYDIASTRSKLDIL